MSSEIPSPLSASPIYSKQEGCVRMAVFGAVCWQKSDNPLIFQGIGSVCFNSLQKRKPASDSATQNEKTRTCGIPCAPIKAKAD